NLVPLGHALMMAQKEAEATHKQKSAIESIVSAIEQMTVSTENISEQSQETSLTAQNNARLAVEGTNVTKSAVSSMQEISSSVEAAVNNVVLLGERSSEISGIIDLIQDISGQTNLLALNAAIEAARAGEHGRGFSVVADEVRKLAISTHTATDQVRSLIQNFHSDMSASIDAIRSVNQYVHQGVEHVNQAGNNLEQIQHGANDTYETMRSIATAIHEQSLANHEIGQSIEKISQLASVTSDVINETASTSDYLEQLSLSMVSAIPSMKEKKDDKKL
ncbi:methyl-accepting chemotaxis protein, partial [Pseudomonadota bacterium]